MLGSFFFVLGRLIRVLLKVKTSFFGQLGYALLEVKSCFFLFDKLSYVFKVKLVFFRLCIRFFFACLCIINDPVPKKNGVVWVRMLYPRLTKLDKKPNVVYKFFPLA